MESLCSRGKQIGLSVSAGGFNHIFGTEMRAVRPAGWGGMQHMLCSLTAARLPGSVICVQHALSSLGKKSPGKSVSTVFSGLSRCRRQMCVSLPAGFCQGFWGLGD